MKILSCSPLPSPSNSPFGAYSASMVSSGHPSLRTSPKKKNKPLPRINQSSSSTPVVKVPPINVKNLDPSISRPEEEAGDADFSHGAIAGPSSPTRRRRRPSASRRRSSSITAAAALISSYSTRSDEDENMRSGKHKAQKVRAENGDDDDDEDGEDFGVDATETIHDARKALFRGRASPYHMALVQLLFSLAQGMPLASQFKVYTYLMCRVYQENEKPNSLFTLPSPPELPSDPVCQDVWVENATSTYAAAMATIGALLSLVLLNRCSKLSDYFGRKPLLLATHILLAISTSFFRIGVLLPTYVGVAVLYVAVMVMEASAGAPLKISVQNYVVDTTTEAQRAGALSFVDGFGQIGAFPSSTLGGWLAVVTQQFFAPFYASIAVYAFAIFYMLVFVPESKKRRHHTLIDDFERFGEGEEQDATNKQDRNGDGEDNTDNETDADTDGGIGTESYFSSTDGNQSTSNMSTWKKLLRRFNFLAPLSVFLPQKKINGTQEQASPLCKRDWRLSLLALIVILEESFQVFLVPVLLLYNTKVFGYDVVQNGYLVSLLQGVRAIYLTICFPWAVKKVRSWFQSRNKRQSTESEEEEEPLLPGNGDNNNDESETRGRFDLVIMLASYLLATASFVLMATTRSWSEQYDKGEQSGVPPWVGVAIAITGLQIGAGSTSIRTALLVNAVSEQEDAREALKHKEEERQRLQQQRQTLRARASYASTNSSTSMMINEDGESFHVHHDRHQSKALAANQILCTAVYAIVPLLTSKIFGIGLNIHHPEFVWAFKAGMAGLSVIATFVLILLYSDRRSS